MAGPIGRRTCACVNTYCSHHQALRASLVPIVAAGHAECWRCGRRLAPGEAFDLGHDDADKTLWRGIECLPCNRATMSRRPRDVHRWEL